MKILFISLLFASGFFVSSIYDYHYSDQNGNEVYLSQYSGKKMLIVNIASESEFAAVQIPQLQELSQQFADSLVIIAFPSNDFGNEPRNNNDIRLLLEHTYHVTFPVAKKTGVKDSTDTTNPVYDWLQDESKNGSSRVKVKRDFQKYLVGRDGKLEGLFSARMNPMDSAIINAITQ